MAAVPRGGARSPQLPSCNRDGRKEERIKKEGKRTEGKGRKIGAKSHRN